MNAENWLNPLLGVSFSTRRFNDISLMPDFVTGGYITVPASSQVAFSCTPKDFGIDGPVISASMIPTLNPCSLIIRARDAVTIDLPTPPFPLTTAITLFTCECGFAGFKRLCGLLPQESACAHPAQSDGLHPFCSSAILTVLFS